MHPLVSRIHPSYRSAFFAWFLSRATLWIGARAAGREPWVSDNLFRSLEAATPGWSVVVHLTGLFGSSAPAVLAALAEALMLLAAIAVYQFVRRDQLPQTAESATWLWAFCPLMALSLPAGDWTFAVALSAISLAALGAHRHFWAAALAAGAIAFRPEAILLWPGFALLGWRTYQPGKQHELSPWATALAPPLAFVTLVVSAITLAGRFGVSLRSLQAQAGWRRDFAWQGFVAHTPEMLALALIAAGAALAITYFRQTPRSWAILALPCLFWPLLYQPLSAAMTILLLAIPLFGYLGRLAADPRLERPLLAASVAGLLLLTL